MRRSRFIGLAKTHLQHICVALGVNVLRVGAWLDEDFKPHRIHKSAFAALASAGA
jgi:transposase